MRYSDKLRSLRPFVNLNINANRKNFTPAEKRIISYYYNRLKGQGYFDSVKTGYKLVSIKGKNKPKLKGLPKVNKRYVEVGTVVKNGHIVTNNLRKVVIRGGKIYVTQNGKDRIWRFEYNIAKNWTAIGLAGHLKKQIGKKNLRKTQYFAIGAGIKYEVTNSVNDSLLDTAREILKLGHRYTPDLTASYEHENQTKRLADWMQEIVVYEYESDVDSRIKARAFYNTKANKKRKKKRPTKSPRKATRKKKPLK